jgi:hypothetical protein
MKYDEVWAVDAKRIEAFFEENPGDAAVIPLPDRTLGSMTMPQTRIIISGENADELYRRFYLSFMTAGG